ncbi:MAG TPA: glycosyltransferase [Verrucomicrobiae bacterium]|nr:glycosyltransferase [Verrucomicrobiae bacterium]
MKDWQKTSACLLAITLVLTVFFWPVICGRSTLAATDILNQLELPFGANVTHFHVKNHFLIDTIGDSCNEAIYFQRCVRSGQCPIWNPLVWCGFPYYAVSTLSYACPLQLPCWLLLPMPAGYDWSIMLHFLAAGVFMFLLLRHWRLGFLPSLLGSLAYCLNTEFAFLYWHPTIRAFAWMPLVIICFDKALQSRSPRYVAATGLFAGVAIISGSIQTAAFVLLLLAIYAAATAFIRRRELSLPRLVSVTAWAGTTAILLSAFQLLPTLELMHVDASGRLAGQSGGFLEGLESIPYLSTFVIPALWGSTESFDLFKAIHTTAIDFQGYIGIVSFAMLLLAVAAWREPQVKVLTWCALGVVALLVFVPPVRERFYYRFFIAYVFAAAGLAAYGLDSLLKQTSPAHWDPNRRWRKTLCGLLVFLGLVAIGILVIQTAYTLWPEPLTRISNRFVARRAVGTLTGLLASGTDWLKTRVDAFWKHYRLTDPAFWIPLGAGGASIAVALARLRGRLLKSCGWILLGLAIIDLTTTAWCLVPMLDLKTSPLYPPSAQTQFLQQSATRVYHWPNSMRGILDVDILMAYDIQAFDADGSMRPLTMRDVLRQTKCLSNAAVLGMCAVTHVLCNTNEIPMDPRFELVSDQDGVRIYRNTVALPRAQFAAHYLTASNLQECKRTMARPDWQAQPIPIIETDRQPPAEWSPLSVHAEVRIVTDRTTRVDIASQTDTPGYVILADTFYPGWRVTVDGHPTVISRANGVQRAVFVEPGTHLVQFRYAPTSIRLGVAISALTLLAVALFVGPLGRCGVKSVPATEKNPRAKLLVFGYLPPPIYGPAMTYQALLRSSFPQRFEVTFVNLTVVRDYRELEVFHWRKLALLARQLVSEFTHLFSQRFDFVFYPISLNRNAFLKDTLFLAIARIFGAPIVLYGHGNGLPEFREKSPGWLRRSLDWTIRGATAAVVLGRGLRFNFLNHLREDQVFVVPTGIEVPSTLPAVTKLPSRFTVLYLGNLVKEKGVFVILDAIPLVRARCPEAHFVFAGAWWSEKDAAEAERLIRERSLASCIDFMGMVDGVQKWKIVCGSDVLVFPTFYRYETFGLVLVEAMGAGLPVVTTRRAAIPEIVEEGTNGLFVAERNPADLAEKIITLARDPALRARMSEANKQKYANYYTIEHYGQRMAAVFDELLKRRSQPGW